MSRMTCKGRRKNAFTLVELLVVVTIIALLVALSLPAVQRSRESSRKLQCANNLKQIGVAFLAHLEAFDAFPSGGNGVVGTVRVWSNGVPETFGKQKWSWGYQILPFTEQTNLWNNPSDTFVASTPVRLYFCPTRRRSVALSGGNWQTETGPRAMTDYAGNAGTSSAGGAMGSAYAGNGGDGIVVQTGTLPQVTADDVVDGLSNTIMVGEKNLNASNYVKQCSPDDNAGYVGGFQDDVVRWGAMGTLSGTTFTGTLFPPAQDTYNGGTENLCFARPHGPELLVRFGAFHQCPVRVLRRFGGADQLLGRSQYVSSGLLSE